MEYGFAISVSDLTSSQMKAIEQSIKNLGGTVKTQTQQMQDNFGALGQAANSLKNVLIEAFAVREIFSFGKELMHTAAEFEGFTNVIKYSSNGIVDAARNLDYVRDSIDRLHLPMKETYESFSEMQAGFYGTGIEGEKLRKVFEGVAEASSVLHLQPAQFSRVTFALKEIGELGTLQARQLRMLSFALPGAGNLAAQALGMTSEKLHAAMKKGQINASDFLPKFAETLTKHFQGGLGNSGNSLISQMNDEKNSIIKLYVDMGESLKPFFVDVLHTVASTMKQIKSIWDSITGNSSFVESLKFIFDWAAKLVPIWLSYKGVMFGIGIVTKYLSVENGILAISMGELTVMTDGSAFAFEGLGAAIAATGIGALVVGLGLLVEQFIKVNNEADEMVDKMTNIQKTSGMYKENTGMYTSIRDRMGIFQTLDKEGKSALLADAITAQKELKDKMEKVLSPSVVASQQKMNQAWKITGYHMESQGQGQHVRVPEYGIQSVLVRDGIKKAFESQSNDQKFLTAQIKNLGDFINQIKKAGVIPNSSILATASGIKDDATHTSNLSGASGGLGQAKQIHVSIGIMQKNEGVRESKDQADEAIQKMIEALNGFSESQNSA